MIRRIQAAPGSHDANRACGELFLQHQDRLYLWCFRFVHDHERALDLAQDVMILAHRALPEFQGRSRFSSWLYVIARHRCLREVRRPGLLLDDEADPGSVAATTAGPDELHEQKESEEVLLQLMRDHLDRHERDALWLRYFEGVSVDEITGMLEIQNASGARGVLQSARRKLRVAIARHRRLEEQ